MKSRFKNLSNFLKTVESITKGHTSARGWWVSAPQGRPRPLLGVLSAGTTHWWGPSDRRLTPNGVFHRAPGKCSSTTEEQEGGTTGGRVVHAWLLGAPPPLSEPPAGDWTRRAHRQSLRGRSCLQLPRRSGARGPRAAACPTPPPACSRGTPKLRMLKSKPARSPDPLFPSSPYLGTAPQALRRADPRLPPPLSK